MLNVKFIVIGNLKESYLRDAAAEYEKRLSAFCRFETVQLKEEKLSDDPSDTEIQKALEREALQIEKSISPRAYRIAMCVEGNQLSSEELAERIERIEQTAGEIVFIIGSSVGLADSVKKSADMRLSVSKMTFPHQLMRVLLLEGVYRAFNIRKGTRYHK
jgi:23S rRNA (pseudouridine1915-N3)-methyltransferase